MNPIVPLLLAALLLPPFVTPESDVQASSSFAVPAFRVGETATYEWTYAGQTLRFEYAIDRLDRTLDMSAREVDVVAIALRDASTRQEQRVSLASMRVESSWLDCARSTSGQCTNWDAVSWMGQGRPGVWGATLVHGRNVTIGDAWTLAGSCRSCVAPIAARVDAPDAASPAGTAFVLDLTRPENASRHDRLHFGLAHAFPLLAQSHDPRGFFDSRLVAHAPGSGPMVPAPATPAAPSYPSALPAAVPFVDGRPVEGAPFRDYPRWSDARAAAGPDPLDLDPNLTLASTGFHVAPRGVRSGSDVVPVERTIYADARFAKDGFDDVGVRYFRRDVYPLGQPLAPGAWSATGFTASGWSIHPGMSCPEQTPPLWDVVRHGESLGLLNDVHGYWWFRTWSPVMACDGWTMDVTGPIHPFSGERPAGVSELEAGSGETESIRYDLQTGLLMSALLWPEQGLAPTVA